MSVLTDHGMLYMGQSEWYKSSNSYLMRSNHTPHVPCHQTTRVLILFNSLYLNVAHLHGYTLIRAPYFYHTVFHITYQYKIINWYHIVLRPHHTLHVSTNALMMQEVGTSAATVLTYRTISNIRRTKSQNLNVSCLGLKLSLRNILNPSVKWRRKM